MQNNIENVQEKTYLKHIKTEKSLNRFMGGAHTATWGWSN